MTGQVKETVSINCVAGREKKSGKGFFVGLLDGGKKKKKPEESVEAEPLKPEDLKVILGEDDEPPIKVEEDLEPIFFEKAPKLQPKSEDTADLEDTVKDLDAEVGRVIEEEKKHPQPIQPETGDMFEISDEDLKLVPLPEEDEQKKEGE